MSTYTNDKADAPTINQQPVSLARLPDSPSSRHPSPSLPSRFLPFFLPSKLTFLPLLLLLQTGQINMSVNGINPKNVLDVPVVSWFLSLTSVLPKPSQFICLSLSLPSNSSPFFFLSFFSVPGCQRPESLEQLPL